MRIGLITVAAVLALAGCGAPDERNAATAEGNAVEPAGNNAAAAAGGDAPSTAANAQEYVTLVAASDLYEIESARLAQEKAERPEVRQLAEAILADHQRSTAELRRAAAEAQPALQVAPALLAPQQANLQVLRGASGAAFDQEYLRQQVEAHERALTLVTAYAAGGESEPLRRHAAGVAGPIQQHLSRARELAVPLPE